MGQGSYRVGRAKLLLVVIASGVISATVVAGPASAAVSLVVAGGPPLRSTVGEFDVGTITFSNFSDGAEATGTVTVQSFTLIPSCSNTSHDCLGGIADPGVFELSATGMGIPPTACEFRTFSIDLVDPATGKVRFTPVGGPVVLGPREDFRMVHACRVDFGVTVRKLPAVDTVPAAPGVQTTAIVVVAGEHQDHTMGEGTATDTSTVEPPTPSITSQATPTALIGQPIRDEATVTGSPGGATPTGTVTFRLWNNTDCLGEPVFTSAGRPLSAGTVPSAHATSAEFTATAPGRYRWVASYVGDGQYAEARGGCNEPNETSVVTETSPGMVTSATPSVDLGEEIWDTATVVGVPGGPAPTGTVTFTAFGPDNSVCAGAPAFISANQSLSGDPPLTTAYSEPFTPTTPGTYRWIATYSGDATYPALSSACNDPGEASTVVSPGFLYVTTSPSLPSQILVDGIPRDTYQLDGLKLVPGSYTVSFAHVPGWTEPAPQTVAVTGGLATTVTGVFTQRGYLQVLTDPAVPGTISVDGIPRDDWWMSTDVPTGSPEVCFGPVAGYDPPGCQTVTVNPGAQTVVTGNYASNPSAPGPAGNGQLRVVTYPALPAQIIVDGTLRDTWGLKWLKLPPGNHTVSFTHVEGWTEPPPQTVTVTDGQVTEVNGEFTQRGFLRVTTIPTVPGTITVDGVRRDDWGIWTDLPGGPIQVCFGPPLGGAPPPPCQSDVLLPSRSVWLEAHYS